MQVSPYLSLLRHNPAFTRLYVAQLASFAGDWFATVALLGMALEMTGSSALATHRLTGSSVRSIRLVTMACSSRSFVLWSSLSPRWSSTAGSALRLVVPARATVCARCPSRRTSSSGLAPTNASSGVPTHQQ